MEPLAGQRGLLERIESVKQLGRDSLSILLNGARAFRQAEYRGDRSFMARLSEQRSVLKSLANLWSYSWIRERVGWSGNVLNEAIDAVLHPCSGAKSG